MKDLTEVLKQKLRELESLQVEVEALQIAMRLCAENDSEKALVDSRSLKMAAGSETSIPGLTPKSMRQFP